MIGVKYLFIWGPEVLKRKSLKKYGKNIFFIMKNMVIPPVSRSGSYNGMGEFGRGLDG
jgi:hypothetical protein